MFVREDLPKLELVWGAYKLGNQTVKQLNGAKSTTEATGVKPPVVEFWEEQDIKLGVVNDTPSNAIWLGTGIIDVRQEMYNAQSYIRMQEDLQRKDREVAELRAFIKGAITLAKTF